jgi:hypothetical protein
LFHRHHLEVRYLVLLALLEGLDLAYLEGLDLVIRLVLLEGLDLVIRLVLLEVRFRLLRSVW